MKKLLKKYTMEENKSPTESGCHSLVGGRNSGISSTISINSGTGNSNENDNCNDNENENEKGSRNGNEDGNWDNKFSGRFSPMSRIVNTSDQNRNLAVPLWNRVQGLNDNINVGDEDLSGAPEGLLGHGQPDSRSTTSDLGSSFMRKEEITATSAIVGNRVKGVDSYREENQALKKEIDGLKARHLHDRIREEKKTEAHIDEEEKGHHVSLNHMMEINKINHYES